MLGEGYLPKPAIEMWRMVAISLYVDPILLAVPIASLCRLVTLPPDYYVISDAGGPLKFGYAIYDSSGVLLWYSALAWPFAPNNNYQNAKEFLAFLIAFVDIILVVAAPKGCHIHWTGDNVSALSWVDENRCKSNFAQRAFIAFTFLCLRFQIEVADVIHRPGHLMGAIDALSRDNPHDLDPQLFRSIDSSVVIDRLLRVCDPTKLLDNDLSDHHTALLSVFSVINELR
jgi:hypothetical protein